jgi:hypothetical protein
MGNSQSSSIAPLPLSLSSNQASESSQDQIEVFPYLIHSLLDNTAADISPDTHRDNHDVDRGTVDDNNHSANTSVATIVTVGTRSHHARSSIMELLNSQKRQSLIELRS